MPPLTTFRVEKEEIGSLAVMRLLERIDNPSLTPVSALTCREAGRRSDAVSLLFDTPHFTAGRYPGPCLELLDPAARNGKQTA